MTVILASGSPRRRELLQGIGLPLVVVVSDVEEKLRHGEAPNDYVSRLAVEKAETVARQHPDAWVVAADTVVVIDNEILEKPRDREDAIGLLSRLSGREHTVYTGLTLHRREPQHQDLRVVTTRVRMTRLSRPEIEWYVDTGEPMDKAGAYAVQGIGAMFVESIEGSYSNVVGMPLSMLLDMMRRAGIDWRKP